MLKQWSTSLIPAHGMYEPFNRCIFISLCLCLCSSTPVSQQCCLQSDNPPPDISRPQALSIDYINKETSSVLLRLSNFAIKCLPDYLVAEHQILLLSDGQKPVTLTNPWHLIMECVTVWSTYCEGPLCLQPVDCSNLTRAMVLVFKKKKKATVICRDAF